MLLTRLAGAPRRRERVSAIAANNSPSKNEVLTDINAVCDALFAYEKILLMSTPKYGGITVYFNDLVESEERVISQPPSKDQQMSERPVTLLSGWFPRAVHEFLLRLPCARGGI